MPTACRLCGTGLGGYSSDPMCDPCSREHGEKPPLVRCEDCGDRAGLETMTEINVAPPEEHYPVFIYLCGGCSESGSYE